MDFVKMTTLALAGSFSLGCSSGPGANAPAADESRASAPPAEAPRAKTVFDPLTQPLGRARDVQNTVDESADRTRQSIAAQERGDSRQ